MSMNEKETLTHPWLTFFRVVNLPTVPGDTLAGAAAVCAMGQRIAAIPLASAAVAGCAFYLFGMADNDIVGAATDGPRRPIPAGRLSLAAARVARGICIFVALIVGAAANLPPTWWIAAFLLALSIVIYNRTKASAVMGLCRGLNALCGGLAFLPTTTASWVALGSVAALGTAYIAFVTWYSTGEEADPARRGRVGLLIRSHLYLQLLVLVAANLVKPGVDTRNLLIGGAVLLVVLRVFGRIFPKVSAS